MKINCLYFKDILNRCLVKFFAEHNDYFQNINGVYVLSKSIGKSKIKSLFKGYIIEEVKTVFPKFDIFNPEINFVIGSCMPRDNILLKYKDAKYFSKKLDSIITDKYQLKYVLKEKDIRIDLVLFNDVFEQLFNSWFESLECVLRTFGSDYSNIRFIKNRKFDCLTLYKIIKSHFGRSNVINVWEKKFQNDKIALVSINELINKCIHEKSKLNSDREFISTYKEVKQFLENYITMK